MFLIINITVLQNIIILSSSSQSLTLEKVGIVLIVAAPSAIRYLFSSGSYWISNTMGSQF